MELAPLLRRGVVKQPAQWIVFCNAAMDILGSIWLLGVRLGAPKGIDQLLFSSTDSPVGNVAIPVLIIG
jgi:hypothetical protein